MSKQHKFGLQTFFISYLQQYQHIHYYTTVNINISHQPSVIQSLTFNSTANHQPSTGNINNHSSTSTINHESKTSTFSRHSSTINNQQSTIYRKPSNMNNILRPPIEPQNINHHSFYHLLFNRQP
jgi:hypothetical protein